MHWIGSGFITIINYSAAASEPVETKAILTEASFDILTENGSEILIES